MLAISTLRRQLLERRFIQHAFPAIISCHQLYHGKIEKHPDKNQTPQKNPFALNLEPRPEVSTKFLKKGLTVMNELSRLQHHTQSNDIRLKGKYEDALKSFQLAIASDESNMDASLALARLHLHFVAPPLSKQIGMALLHRCANSGMADAQYELSCVLREQAAYFDDGDPESELQQCRFSLMKASIAALRKAASQGHPDALFHWGTARLAGEYLKVNVLEAKRCFREAAEKGHSAASTVYGAMVAQEIEEADGAATDKFALEPQEAIERLEAAAEDGSELAGIWLNRLSNKIKPEVNVKGPEDRVK